ncbi:MAG: BACON domain-containing protein [Bacteroidales bacterium]|nr:BACON domain-containing protein [Bacteroidales bacterium]
MKLRHFFMAAIAGVFAFAACEDIPEELLTKISLDPLELNLGPEEQTASVTFTCTRDWSVSVDLPEWITLNAKEGKGSSEEQTIRVTVLENTGNNREATITFSSNIGKASLLVRQEGKQGAVDNGEGTLEKPYTVAGVIAYLETLGGDVVSEKEVYVKGKISTILTDKNGVEQCFSNTGTYGNATFNISDDGKAANEFQCYRVLYLGNRKFVSGNTDIKVGDDVIIFGKVVNYRGNTPETSQGTAYLYSLNGNTTAEGGSQGGDETTAAPAGTGTATDPFNVARAIEKAKSAGTTPTTEEFYVKGKVANVVEAFGTQYGNGTFDLVDEGYTAVFKAFRILYFGNKKWEEGNKSVNKGDEIIVVGKLVNYQNNTPETSQGTGYLYSLNGEVGEGGNPNPGTDEEARGDGTLENPYNPKAAYEAAAALPADGKSDKDVYIMGKISSIKYTFSAQYGTATFNISEQAIPDATKETQFPCYSVYYLGNRAWVEGDAQIAEGMQVIVCGKLTNYKGNTPETASKEAYIYWMEGVDNPGGGGNPGGETQEIQSVTIAEFLAAAESQTQPYKLHGKMSNIKNTQYGNFDLVDATGSTVYVYGLTATNLGYGAKNDQSFASLNLKEGDEITIIGYRGSYNGTPQVLYAYFAEKTGGEEPPVVEEVKTVTVAEFNAAAESQTQPYKLTGKISGDVNTTYGNFDLVDETGTVYVYGLTATDLGYGGKNDKSFASLNLVAGDTITIIGYRGSYNDKIEVMYAYFVEKVASADPYFTVKSIAQTSTRGFNVVWETNVKQGTYYSWSLYRKSNQAEDGIVYAAMGRLMDMSVTSLNEYDGGPDGAGWYEDLVVGETYYFAINLYDNASGMDPVVSNDPEQAFFVAADMTNPGGGGNGEFVEVALNIVDYATANGWQYVETNGDPHESFVYEGITFTASWEGTNKNGIFYSSLNEDGSFKSGDWRFYQARKGGVTITAPAGKELVKVKFTFKTKNNDDVILYGDTPLASGDEAQVSGSSILFTIGSTAGKTNAQARISDIVVTLK